MKERIINDNGSVQNLDIPVHIKELYKTVWEIKQRNVLKMAADRGPFIDQSQSLNVHIGMTLYLNYFNTIIIYNKQAYSNIQAAEYPKEIQKKELHQ